MRRAVSKTKLQPRLASRMRLFAFWLLRERTRKLWKATNCVRILPVFPLASLPLFICMQTATPVSLSHTHTHIDHALVICNAFVNANCAQLQQQPAKCANKHDKQLHVMPHTHTYTYTCRVYVFSHTYLAILAWLPISVTQTFINFALICHRLFVSLSFSSPATCRQHQRQSIVITEDGTVWRQVAWNERGN